MARGGRFGLSVDASKTRRLLQVAAHHVERGTRKATQAALDEILAESLRQVPRQTNTLANSSYTEIQGYRRNFTGTVGYGRGTARNPTTGQLASAYMVEVHEDLDAFHPTGKAKFLEDPVRMYQEKFGPGAARAIQAELERGR